MRKISFFIIFLLSFVQFVQAESFTKADADKAYQENKYAEAIKMYENILATQGESAVVYYNLGNSYFKEKSNTTKFVEHADCFAFLSFIVDVAHTNQRKEQIG